MWRTSPKPILRALMSLRSWCSTFISMMASRIMWSALSSSVISFRWDTQARYSAGYWCRRFSAVMKPLVFLTVMGHWPRASYHDALGAVSIVIGVLATSAIAHSRKVISALTSHFGSSWTSSAKSRRGSTVSGVADGAFRRALAASSWRLRVLYSWVCDQSSP